MKKNLFLIFLFSMFVLTGFAVQTRVPLSLYENISPKENDYAQLKTSASVIKVLDEVLVNNDTPSDQREPTICKLSSDRFAVAWTWDSGASPDVHASVFNAATGNNITNEFRVNYYTTGIQNDPSITALSSDTFAVAWGSYNQDAGGNDYGVYARVFNATTGENVTREFLINDETADDQNQPSIAALSSDTFAVAWRSNLQDGNVGGVYASVFNATTGENITNEFRVNIFTANSQENPSITALSNETFAVAFSSDWQDDDLTGVFASVFNATTGENITNEFRVNYEMTNSQLNPSITALSNETFAVAYESDGDNDGDSNGVYARVFNATTGENVTREFLVNQETASDQDNPSISALSSDTFVIAWESDGHDGEGEGVYARVFNAITGNSITNEFLVNNWTWNDQKTPSIAALSSDELAIAWASLDQPPDSSFHGIFAAIFRLSTSSAGGALPSADDDDDDDDEAAIPYGNYYLGFAAIAILVLIIVMKKKALPKKNN